MRTTRILFPMIVALALALWLALGARERTEERALERGSATRVETPRAPETPNVRLPATEPAIVPDSITEHPLEATEPPGERGRAPASDIGSGWHADLATAGVGRTRPRDDEPQTRLAPSELAPGARFGAHVALNGATAAIAAPLADGGGLVFVFERAGSRWSEVARLVTPDGAFASFGASLALSGDWLVVGAPGDARTSGAVLAYGRVAGAWTLEQTLHAPLRAAGDGFGASVALTRAHLAVGGATSAACCAYADDGGWRLSGLLENPAGRGVVQIALDGDQVALVHDGGTAPRVSFHRFHEGAWERVDAFTEERSSAAPRVSMWRDTLAVAGGAQLALYDLSGLFSLAAAGSVALPASSTPARPVALGAQRVFVGEPASDLAAAGAGAVLRFARDADGLRQERALVARDAHAGDELGTALAADGALLLAGAPGGDYAIVWELPPPGESRSRR